MTPTNDNATADPDLLALMKDEIVAHLQARLAEVEAERDVAYDALNVERAAVWRVSGQLDAALSREKEAKATVDEAIAALKEDSNLERPICCNGVDCGCMGVSAGDYAAYQLHSFFERAALTDPANNHSAGDAK